MKNLFLISSFILLCFFSFSQYTDHNLNVEINIYDNSLEVLDIVTLPENHHPENGSVQFRINENLDVKADSPDLKLELESTENGLAKYTATFKEETSHKIRLTYSGKIYDEITTGAAEYARGFSETSGIIFEKGVYLAGASHWVPDFDQQDLSTFHMTVTLDSAWNVVSQGKRTVNNKEGDKSIIRYESPNPVDEIYLIAAPWTEYSTEANNVLVQAFLRTPDEELAQRYLQVTSHYLNLYNDLIGPYPYSKFALVENFWETGYGMPSFTLLGEKVIRFPWILHSSYPHELLHNYWGNSVFVDYESGNWCEGITAYMADHLIKEQRGQGADYRRTTLQKFTDFVNDENDFPVVNFRSRNNSAEEAIGYGKVLMINEMLRNMVGDSLFKESYRYFYKNYKFEKAGFNDIKTSFEKVTGLNLAPFFKQWLYRKGAPGLELHNVVVKKNKSTFDLSFTLKQLQLDDAFTIDIPVVVYLKGKDVVVKQMVTMDKKEQDYKLTFKAKPLKIEVDPGFNVFRKLDSKEVPPSLSQVQGSRKSKIILPINSPLYNNYKSVAKTWQETQKVQGKTIELVDDANLDDLPEGESFWVFGKENKFAAAVQVPIEYTATLADRDLNAVKKAKNTGSLVYAIPNPKNDAYTIAYLHTINEKAFAGLTRKLPHYGKYSYLGFEGDSPTNTVKGNFVAVNSPLSYVIPYDKKEEITAKRIPRKALAFSKSKRQ